MAGWFSKIKIKNYILILIISLIFWIFLLYKSDGYNTYICLKDNCKVNLAKGPNSSGGRCKGNNCKSGDCIGENCSAGDCIGKNCKAGNCYGINCSPGPFRRC